MKIVTCLRCGHEWPTKLERPVRCAKCRTPYWDRPKPIVIESAEHYKAVTGKDYSAKDTVKFEHGPELCEHDESAFHCTQWGCKFYEVPNGRR